MSRHDIKIAKLVSRLSIETMSDRLSWSQREFSADVIAISSNYKDVRVEILGREDRYGYSINIYDSNENRIMSAFIPETSYRDADAIWDSVVGLSKNKMDARKLEQKLDELIAS